MISAIHGGVIFLSTLVGPLPQLPQAVDRGHCRKVPREQLVTGQRILLLTTRIGGLSRLAAVAVAEKA